MTGNVIQGNYIGTDITGTQDRGNTLDGIRIRAGASNTTIGGTAIGAGNVISANVDDGIDMEDTTGNVIQGNFIGTDATGTVALGNEDGIAIKVGAINNTIGGTTAAARNIISASDEGIQITSATATGNLIQGNYIGTDITGTADLGNTNAGISINTASGNTIGGMAAGAGNLFEGLVYSVRNVSLSVRRG